MQLSLPIVFLKWYVFAAPRGILLGWRNFLVWGADIFSLPLHLRTFFSPWRRTVHYYKDSGLSLKNIAESLLFTNFSRLIGMVVRTILILIGTGFEAVVFVMGLLAFIVWFLLPVLAIVLLINVVA